MTLEDILTLSKAGYTAQQITAMSQQMVQPQPQMVQAQPQMVQPQPQMVQPQPQMVQPQPQMVQPQPQMVQPQPQMVQAQPQMVQPQAQPQMVQGQFSQNGQYVPVLPQNNVQPMQNDPMKDVMLQQYMNAPEANMYNVHDVVSGIIGANAPVKQTGGDK